MIFVGCALGKAGADRRRRYPLVGLCLHVVGKSLVSIWGIVLFILLLAIIFGGGQYLLLGFVKGVSKDLRTKKADVNITYRIVTIIQYVISAILVILVFQMLMASYFSSTSS